jgi:hypothetical protein
MTGSNRQETFAAYWPGGVGAVPRIAPADRPDSLNGRTIGFLWDYMFRGDEIFPVIEEAIVAANSDVRFVGHDAFGSTFGGDEHEVLARLPAELRRLGVDAVISGIGC